MAEQNRRELLERLQRELENIKPSDEQGRERLRQLDADIQNLLQRSDEDLAKDDPMLERFQESIDHFESSHPQFTLMLSQIMTILSNAGI